MHTGFLLVVQETLRGGHTYGEHLVALFFLELEAPLPFQ